MNHYLAIFFVLIFGSSNLTSGAFEPASPRFRAGDQYSITGELRRWHKVTIDFSGPNTSETANPNPFMDFRLNVTFTHTDSGKVFVVPGFYAADGDAANTSASGGGTWRVHFSPDEVGAWQFMASFRTGSNIAVDDNRSAGTSAGFFDGVGGELVIAETNKSGRDFRGKGRLDYVGQHYLRFAGNGQYFLKQGADSPENLLAYDEFDGPFVNDGQNDHLIKNWAPHENDWNAGDPTWAGGKGKGLIGAVNYLASEEMNAFSFLTMNINGDDRNVFPYLSYNERLRMDVSRLEQWEIVFEHADKLGLFLHFKTQETENDQLLDGGALGNQRRLYYRELIARFSHHLALNWNIGEENSNTIQQRKDFAQYFCDHDPYGHHIVLHTYPNQQSSVYNPLLGNQSKYTGPSIQTSNQSFSQVFSSTKTWVDASAAAGKPWAVAVDEPGDAQHALRPDNDAGNSHVDGRKNALWGTLMAGGWGNEYYFGYGHAHSDLTLQDFRSRDQWWDVCRYALQFFTQNEIPFWEMKNDNSVTTTTSDLVFFKPAECYVIYLREGGSTEIDLTGISDTVVFDVRWFDPRNGGSLQTGSITMVAGGAFASVGFPPTADAMDWVALLQVRDSKGENLPPTVSIDSVIPVNDSENEFRLEATVTDDGQVLNTPILQWSLENGPGTATFSAPASSNTDVLFSQPGTYIVKLTADDGEFQICDTETIDVDPPGSGGLQLEFATVDDATVEGANGVNNDVIKVQLASPSRIGYLKFDVEGIFDAEVADASLALTVAQDPGSGTLQLFEGMSNDWAEETINSANAPETGTLLQQLDMTYSLGQVVEFDVSQTITNDGVYTFVLRHAGGNDVWFSSKEGNATPQLLINLNEVLLGDINCDGVVDLLDVQPFIAVLSNGEYSVKADFDSDGAITLLDVGPFVEVLAQ